MQDWRVELAGNVMILLLSVTAITRERTFKTQPKQNKPTENGLSLLRCFHPIRVQGSSSHVSVCVLHAPPAMPLSLSLTVPVTESTEKHT